MITTDCRSCGRGPMDLPGDEICDGCRQLAREEDPWAFADDYLEDHDATCECWDCVPMCDDAGEGREGG